MKLGLLAQIPGVDIEAPKVSPALWDLFYVGAVALGLAVVIFITVAVTRSRHRHRRRSRSGPEILKNTDEHLREKLETAEDDQPVSEGREHRRRRRRRDHRPRNPTLAEAGGLPPERDSNAAPHTGL
jgi:hypothetical protein